MRFFSYTLYVFIFAATSCYSDVDCGSHTGVCPHGGVFGCHRVEFVSGYCGCLYRETSARARSAQIPDENDVVEETVLSETDNGMDEIIESVAETGLRWMSKPDGVQQDIIDTVMDNGVRWDSKSKEVKDIFITTTEKGVQWILKNAAHNDLVHVIEENAIDWMDKISNADDVLVTVRHDDMKWTRKNSVLKEIIGTKY